MPDDCGWTESNDPSGLLDTPAKIDVIPGFAVFGIEAAQAFKRPAIKRHVTAGDVLGDCIGKQDMAWTAWRCCNTRLNPIFCRRCNVRSAHPGIIATHERADHIVEPIHVRHAVGVGVGKHFTLCSSGASVPRVA